MTKFIVGKKVRYVGANGEMVDMTHGKKYLIVEVDSEGDAGIYDDGGDKRYFSEGNKFFELVDEGKPVEASPTVIELLANISRRLYEAEQTIKSQAYEINELYKAVADRG